MKNDRAYRAAVRNISKIPPDHLATLANDFEHHWYAVSRIGEVTLFTGRPPFRTLRVLLSLPVATEHLVMDGIELARRGLQYRRVMLDVARQLFYRDCYFLDDARRRERFHKIRLILLDTYRRPC